MLERKFLHLVCFSWLQHFFVTSSFLQSSLVSQRGGGEGGGASWGGREEQSSRLIHVYTPPEGLTLLDWSRLVNSSDLKPEELILSSVGAKKMLISNSFRNKICCLKESHITRRRGKGKAALLHLKFRLFPHRLFSDHALSQGKAQGGLMYSRKFSLKDPAGIWWGVPHGTQPDPLSFHELLTSDRRRNLIRQGERLHQSKTIS